MIEKTLGELGFTNGEIKVYLTLLKIGETTTGKIIERAKISGGKVYQILSKLENKGLVSHIVKEKTKYFSAASPEKILDYLKEEEENLNDKKKEIEKQMPTLLNLHNLSSIKHQATLFSGVRGFETAIFQALNELDKEDEVIAMGVRGDKGEVFNVMWEKWHKERARRKIMGRFLFSEKNKELDNAFKKIKYTEIKYLHGITPSAIGILKDMVLIQTYDEEPSCLLIKNEGIAQSFKTFFETMWFVAKKM